MLRLKADGKQPQSGQEQPTENKYLVNLLPSVVGGFFASTATVLSTVVSTVSTVTVVKCIPSDHLKATDPCIRRKRYTTSLMLGDVDGLAHPDPPVQ